ncbi:tRNA pseudouridine synthase A [Desulfurococcus mucosus]|uniref:tRNA pseudouridine synthase A n=1 Tax=Desulfurococcus mucosus TaxID=2275 RepID=UPI000A49DF25|nr:tRNA pseudouridine synthase A [Desulfurococcus mucosus]
MGLVEKGVSFIDHVTTRAGYRNEWLVLREADTSPDHGTLPYERRISDHINYGVVNLDKPPGPTSHEVVAWVKKMFGVEKAGHGGTLEPPAGRPQGDRRPTSGARQQHQGHR